MSDGIDSAASAFDKAIGNEAPAARGNAPQSRPSEVMFGNLGDLEVDEESPAEGGGDHLRAPGEVEEEPKPRRRAKPVDRANGDDEEVDPEDLLYQDDPDHQDTDDQEDDQDDPDDQDTDDQDDPDEGELNFDAKVKVTVDGEDAEVTVREALDGYIRTETFHKRMNEINEIRDVMDREASTLVEDRKRYIGMIDEMGETLTTLLPKEPDWDTLFAQDPTKARAMQKNYGELKGKIDELKAKRAKAIEEAQEQTQAQLASYAARERQKFEDSNPNWKGPEGEKRKAKDINSMVRTLRSAGFKDPEIAQAYDSRMLTIALKASKFDRMMAAKPKLIPRGKGPATQGAGSNRTAPRGLGKAQKQLARSGKVADAASVFAQLLSKPRSRR